MTAQLVVCLSPGCVLLVRVLVAATRWWWCRLLGDWPQVARLSMVARGHNGHQEAAEYYFSRKAYKNIETS